MTGQEPPASTTFSENRPFASTKVALPGTVNSRTLDALIDTGGQCTLAAPMLIESLNRVIELDYPPLQGAARTRIELLGALRLRIAVDSLEPRTLIVRVAKGPLDGADLIVGMDYLEQFSFVIRRGVFEAIC